MKKVRERLSGREGFTLVELIVVIVIILVLSAVMVPNVMKYVDKASKSNTQSEAATMLTQVQADVAEIVATKGVDKVVNKGSAGATVVDNNGVKIECVDRLSGAIKQAGSKKKKAGEFVIQRAATGSGSTPPPYEVGSVTEFAYQDGSHFVIWTLKNGWYDVDSTATPAP